MLRLRLSGGRELSYVKSQVKDGSISYEGTLQTSGKWGRIEAYGARCVENIVQAVARDCLAEAIIRVETLGYPVVFHVHDELIAEVNTANGKKNLQDILDAIARPMKSLTL